MDKVKQLVEDYQRRLKTVTAELELGGNDLTINRLGTKASCYRTFIAELERSGEWTSATENKEIPNDAHSFEVFSIKDCADSPTGKQAFIGFKLDNGNFQFIGVPFIAPDDKTLPMDVMDYLALSGALLFDMIPDNKVAETIARLKKWNDALLDKYEIVVKPE